MKSVKFMKSHPSSVFDEFYSDFGVFETKNGLFGAVWKDMSNTLTVRENDEINLVKKASGHQNDK